MLLLLSVALAEAPASGWTFTPTLQLRPRFELDTLRDGDADTAPQWYLSQRSRLGGEAASDRFVARMVVQDVRLWGTETDTLKDFVADAFDVHEAWIRWRSGEGVNLTVGRQELYFHEQRLVGAVDWAQQGRAFDAVRLGLRQGAWNAELAGAVTGEGVPNYAAAGKDQDKLVVLARGGWGPKEGPTRVVDLVSITETDAAAEQLRETVGLYAAGTTGILSGRVEGYAQLGSLGDAEYRAWMAAVSATVAPDVSGKPRFTLWFDNLSGDADLADSTIAAFQAPFGTNHKFYGTMDVIAFTEGAWIDGRGLRDAALKVDLVPVEKLKLNLDAHLFLPAVAPTGQEAGTLGEEVDLWASGPLAKGVSLSGGASVLLRPDRDPDAWVFCSLDVAPAF